MNPQLKILRMCGSAVHWLDTDLNRNDAVGALMQNREIQVICYEVVEAGRCVCLTLTYKGCRFKLINIHAVTEKNERLALIEK